MSQGFLGRILWVDLTEDKVQERTLSSDHYRQFLGGHGLGVRVLFEHMPAGADALGPGNVLGFVPGLLNGTGVPLSARFAVVGKSPLTGGWGEANAGGHFGPVLRAAGFDGVFVTGAAREPVYLLIEDGRADLRDARHLWGLDVVETDERIKEEVGQDAQIVAIGPAGEREVLFAAVMTGDLRAAARSGLGAVMGSKRLKAVVVRGSGKVPVHDDGELKRLNREYSRLFKQRGLSMAGALLGLSKILVPLLRLLRIKLSGGPTAAVVQAFREYGTCSGVALATEIGDGPVRNWTGVGVRDFPLERSLRISDDEVIQHQVKRYHCRHCPVGCGGIVRFEGPRYGVEEGRKPEFETLVSLGSLLLNDDLESIIRVNNICDRQGLDTISTGGVVAFALECFEHGLIGPQETGGLDLTWGSSEAIVELVGMIVRREGIGDLLADGVKRAAERIGRGAEEFAIHAGGQELPMHDPRYEPLVGLAYQVDPTPGRHITSNSGLYGAAFVQEVLEAEGVKPPGRYEAAGKGQLLASVNRAVNIISCAGICTTSLLIGRPPVLEWINATTGWDLSFEELLRSGQRIQLLRHMFNLREGVRPQDSKLAVRATGRPPLVNGPLRGVSLDMDAMAKQYYRAMGLDEITAAPNRELLESLGIGSALD